MSTQTDPITLRTVATAGDEPQTTDLANAECAIVVTATPTRDGRVRVRCEPQVQHGDRRPRWEPTADGTGFERHDQRPCERFPTLAWEVTLARHEILLIGSLDDSAGNLGASLFEIRDPARLRQRVLAIQADAAESAQRAGAAPVSGALVR